MSESEITITATFPNIEIAKEVEAAMNALSLENGVPFHEYIETNGLTKGMSFCDPSWWIPERIERKENALDIKLIGSPSGYCEEKPEREDDIVVWLRLCGAEKITGKLIIDGGGDVEEVSI